MIGNITLVGGKLYFAGIPVRELAEKYSTPLYLLDENRLRENMRAYVKAMKETFPEGSMTTYASKALCFKELYKILDSENMGADVVSGGELFTAHKAGFPMEKVCFHGNYKSDDEIRYALELGAGFIMVDSEFELGRLNEIALKMGKKADIILRLTPNIDPHTFAAVNTGTIDCQFGIPIETGDALEITRQALALEGISLKGFHCHIGSQIFSQDPFLLAIDVMANYISNVKAETGYECEYLNLGGGIGVKYVESDPDIDVYETLVKIGGYLKKACAEKNITEPKILLEPGRSIVADAGMTVYTSGAVKYIKGGRNYVIIDGGMSDNPRYALYGSQYTVLNADRMDEEKTETYTIAGRCCESGALIQENVKMPRTESGDIIAVCTTGAYNYSMASNYNRIGKPPIVLIKDKKDRLSVRRQSYEDMISCEE